MNTTSVITIPPITNRLIPPPLININSNQENIQTIEDFYNELRTKRNELLAKTDWTMLSDVSLSKEKKAEYIKYRQQLRDLPLTATPENITWPIIPS
jgi:hypothetical protein